jgi:hypothetical protein
MLKPQPEVPELKSETPDYELRAKVFQTARHGIDDDG